MQKTRKEEGVVGDFSGRKAHEIGYRSGEELKLIYMYENVKNQNKC